MDRVSSISNNIVTSNLVHITEQDLNILIDNGFDPPNMGGATSLNIFVRV